MKPENIAFICEKCDVKVIWFCKTNIKHGGMDCPACSAIMKEYSVSEEDPDER